MSSQPFPGLNSKVTAPDGTVTPVWRSFFQTLWDRGGGVAGAAFAALNGNRAHHFQAAAAVDQYDVVNLGQATGLYQPLGAYAPANGNTSQTFNVADAVLSTGATSLQQATALIAAAVAPKAPLASPAFTGVPIAPSYPVAGLPSPAAGGFIFVFNESGGAVLAFADGTNWRRVTDRAIVT